MFTGRLSWKETRSHSHSFAIIPTRTDLKKDREAKLVEMLNSWTFDRPFGVYYDKIDNEPAVFEDMEYDTRFRDYYLGCI